MYSELTAVPYNKETCFMFRIANWRKIQLIEVQATLMVTLKRKNNGTVTREYHRLELERDSVTFFPLH